MSTVLATGPDSGVAELLVLKSSSVETTCKRMTLCRSLNQVGIL